MPYFANTPSQQQLGRGPSSGTEQVRLGVLAPVLSSGVSLVASVVVGGLTGSFFHKGLGPSKEDLARISGELGGGKAALAVLAEGVEAEEVSAKLAELGGQLETHEVTDEAIEEASAVNETAEEVAASE